MNRTHKNSFVGKAFDGKLLAKSAAAMMLISAAAPAFADDDGVSFAVYGGYRDGGSLDMYVSVNALNNVVASDTEGRSASLNGGEAYSASVELPYDAGRQLQIFFTYQETGIGVTTAVPGTLPTQFDLPLNVSYLHIGGTNYFEGEVGKGAYVVGGLGGTLLDPTVGGYDGELRFSLSLGLGYQLPLGDHLAFRLEGRGYFTLINSSGGMFCGNGACAISVSGDSVFQGEIMLGLAFRL